MLGRRRSRASAAVRQRAREARAARRIACPRGLARPVLAQQAEEPLAVVGRRSRAGCATGRRRPRPPCRGSGPAGARKSSVRYRACSASVTQSGRRVHVLQPTSVSHSGSARPLWAWTATRISSMRRKSLRDCAVTRQRRAERVGVDGDPVDHRAEVRDGREHVVDPVADRARRPRRSRCRRTPGSAPGGWRRGRPRPPRGPAARSAPRTRRPPRRPCRTARSRARRRRAPAARPARGAPPEAAAGPVARGDAGDEGGPRRRVRRQAPRVAGLPPRRGEQQRQDPHALAGGGREARVVMGEATSGRGAARRGPSAAARAGPARPAGGSSAGRARRRS